jgi:hypothetical protein
MGRKMVKIDNRKDVWAKDAGIGSVEDIVVRNIHATGEDIPGISIRGTDANHPIRRVLFENVKVNGSTTGASSDCLEDIEHVEGFVRSFERSSASPSR